MLLLRTTHSDYSELDWGKINLRPASESENNHNEHLCYNQWGAYSRVLKTWISCLCEWFHSKTMGVTGAFPGTQSLCPCEPLFGEAICY
jgi:hypothetical protein